MLILTRKRGENLVLDGQIVVRILDIRGDGVQLALESPDEVSASRQEQGPTPPDRSPAAAVDEDDQDDACTPGLDDYALDCANPEAGALWQQFVADRGWLLEVEE
jgi:carbon storage regulator